MDIAGEADVQGTRRAHQMHDDLPNVQSHYAHSPKELRRGIGCTSERLLENTLLCHALQQRSRKSRGRAESEALIAELTELILSLGDPKFRHGLLVALRLDPRYRQRSLTERRKRYNIDLNRSSDPESRSLHVDNIRTMERRENVAIEQVSRHLYRGNSHLLPAHAHLSDIPSSSGTSGPGALATEAILYSCSFSETGVLERQDVTRWVRATRPDHDSEVTTTHRYFSSHGKDGPMTIESLYGCRISEKRVANGGGLFAKIKLHKDLTPEDGLYSFGYRVLVNSSLRCAPVISWRPRETSTQRIEFHLTFHSSHAPCGHGGSTRSARLAAHLSQIHERDATWKSSTKVDTCIGYLKRRKGLNFSTGFHGYGRSESRPNPSDHQRTAAT